jgi:hypothetical protein
LTFSRKGGGSDATTNIRAELATDSTASLQNAIGIILRGFLAQSVFPHHSYSSFLLYHSAIKATVWLEALAEL